MQGKGQRRTFRTKWQKSSQAPQLTCIWSKWAGEPDYKRVLKFVLWLKIKVKDSCNWYWLTSGGSDTLNGCQCRWRRHSMTPLFLYKPPLVWLPNPLAAGSLFQTFSSQMGTLSSHRCIPLSSARDDFRLANSFCHHFKIRRLNRPCTPRPLPDFFLLRAG